MNTYCDVISFRSKTEHFEKECSGLKNNTALLLTEEELKEVKNIIDNHETVFIRISEHLGTGKEGIEKCGKFFYRSLIDFTSYKDERIEYYIGIFTW